MFGFYVINDQQKQNINFTVEIVLNVTKDILGFFSLIKFIFIGQKKHSPIHFIIFSILVR